MFIQRNPYPYDYNTCILNYTCPKCKKFIGLYNMKKNRCPKCGNIRVKLKLKTLTN